MIELLLIAITWYITKLFYTRDPEINIPKKETDIIRATCFRCSRSEYIAKQNLRVPSYCMSCK